MWPGLHALHGGFGDGLSEENIAEREAEFWAKRQDQRARELRALCQDEARYERLKAIVGANVLKDFL